MFGDNWLAGTVTKKNKHYILSSLREYISKTNTFEVYSIKLHSLLKVDLKVDLCISIVLTYVFLLWCKMLHKKPTCCLTCKKYFEIKYSRVIMACISLQTNVPDIFTILLAEHQLIVMATKNLKARFET